MKYATCLILTTVLVSLVCLAPDCALGALNAQKVIEGGRIIASFDDGSVTCLK